MMLSFRFVLIAFVLLLAASSAHAQRAVIVVRHAEKQDQSKDPALSEAGHARARALASLLARSGVTAIYGTQYRRTVQTAQPLADALKLVVQTKDDSRALVADLKARHASDVVLVAGHSNTIPEILRLLGHPVEETIADDDFGNVFVLVPREGAAPTVVRLRY